MMMWGGKKSTAQKHLLCGDEDPREKGGGDDALKLFKKAVEKLQAASQVKTRRVAAPTTRCRSK